MWVDDARTVVGMMFVVCSYVDWYLLSPEPWAVRPTLYLRVASCRYSHFIFLEKGKEHERWTPTNGGWLAWLTTSYKLTTSWQRQKIRANRTNWGYVTRQIITTNCNHEHIILHFDIFISEQVPLTISYCYLLVTSASHPTTVFIILIKV
jgi:hypothetical protein